MTDIVERLRKDVICISYPDRAEMQFEAADEIERLRAEVKKARDETAEAYKFFLVKLGELAKEFE